MPVNGVDINLCDSNTKSAQVADLEKEKPRQTVFA